MQGITKELEDYVIEAVRRGVQVISLADPAGDKRIKFVGHACINREKLPVPIVTKLELVE